MKLYVLEVNFRIDCMRFNKRQLWKIKIKWYTIPIKVLFLSSFEKQKEFVLALSKTTDQKEDRYKETHNICK